VRVNKPQAAHTYIMSSEEKLNLSIDETNKLRAELGLKPLRVNNAPPPSVESTQQEEKELLEMSVDETNGLRAKLGLAPLRTASSSSSNIVHKPAENDRETQEAAERIQRSKLQRDVQQGISSTFGSSTLADEHDSAMSWAEKMRQQKSKSTTTSSNATKKKKKEIKHQSSTVNSNYDEKDLEGLNVAHNMTEIEAGSTTILTLADDSLLETTTDGKRPVGLKQGDATLENVNLTERKIQQDGIQKKRQLELGMGRAGGYAGFDDDEFEELGGSQAPSRFQRGAAPADVDGKKARSKGFLIGQDGGEENGGTLTDFDAIQQGRTISLEPAQADVAASDFMTLEEEMEEKALRKKSKDGKFKNKKKKEKKEKKKRRKTESDDEEEQSGPSKTTSLLDQLEETAVVEPTVVRKRRRSDSDEVEPEPTVSVISAVEKKNSSSEVAKRAKYDEIMDKGNARTRAAFEEKKKPKQEEVLDEEPDDSFLNAALAKARRLNRLREMSQKKVSGADAVAKAVQSIKKEDITTSKSGTMTFAIDDTREFTRALRAKAQQKEREHQKAKAPSVAEATAEAVVKKEDDGADEPKPMDTETDVALKVEDVEEEEEEVDINELAKEVKNYDMAAGTTAESGGVGRGMSAFVSMLKQTGEISEKNGNEELRGRAKDERNYSKPLDLKKVVKIGANASDKDKEFASREVKLEYRDKHGRLLTQKEAFRELCYQFHGYGASKKNEEKRLKQIGREQAEGRLASQQVTAARDGTAAGTLGALKATQKATGKAFVVHKT
jgi:U4/U6.U5 tri-snRNP-associated protein 1